MSRRHPNVVILSKEDGRRIRKERDDFLHKTAADYDLFYDRYHFCSLKPEEEQHYACTPFTCSCHSYYLQKWCVHSLSLALREGKINFANADVWCPDGALKNLLDPSMGGNDDKPTKKGRPKTKDIGGGDGICLKQPTAAVVLPEKASQRIAEQNSEKAKAAAAAAEWTKAVIAQVSDPIENTMDFTHIAIEVDAEADALADTFQADSEKGSLTTKKKRGRPFGDSKSAPRAKKASPTATVSNIGRRNHDDDDDDDDSPSEQSADDGLDPLFDPNSEYMDFFSSSSSSSGGSSSSSSSSSTFI